MSNLKTISLQDLDTAVGGKNEDWLDKVSKRENYVKAGENMGPLAGGVSGTIASGGNPAGGVLGFVAGKEYGGSAMGALNDAGSWIGKKIGNWLYP